MSANETKIREEILALLSRKDYRPLNKIEIADKLGVSVIIVKLHRRRVMDKMRAGSLADLVRSAEVLKKPTYIKG